MNNRHPPRPPLPRDDSTPPRPWAVRTTRSRRPHHPPQARGRSALPRPAVALANQLRAESDRFMLAVVACIASDSEGASLTVSLVSLGARWDRAGDV